MTPLFICLPGFIVEIQMAMKPDKKLNNGLILRWSKEFSPSILTILTKFCSLTLVKQVCISITILVLFLLFQHLYPAIAQSYYE